MKLRPYQIDLDQRTRQAWADGARNIALVSPTGSGKTAMKTHIIKTMNLVTCSIAHRQELVLQISEAYARFGIPHRLIAPTAIVKFCVHRHMQLFGKSYYDQNSRFAVAGVQTLLRRADSIRNFLNAVQMWDIDECHHCIPDNQWGKATQLFPNAIGLGVTATPLRCDRKPLDGVFDTLINGPTMRDLINDGHLSEYRIFCPPVSLDMARIRTSGGSGEFVQKDVTSETDRSTIVGDVVDHYLRIAPGKRGLTFAVNVESATQIAAAYNAAGVPAAVVTAKTPDRIRTDLLDRLARGDVLQLVNVDLFGEGMDCPALEVVSMARPTQSYGLYVQQFGRVLRPFEGKEHGILIDHVGNVVRHGLPDAPRDWSLSAPEGKGRIGKDDAIPLTSCVECFRPYERVKPRCPYCGHKPVPAERSGPEHVDGDLVELDPEVLAQMRGEIDRIDGEPLVPSYASQVVARSIISKWRSRQTAQHTLRETISSWAGPWKHEHGATDSEIHRRFYLRFGVDIASAQALGATDAATLTEKVRNEIS